MRLFFSAAPSRTPLDQSHERQIVREHLQRLDLGLLFEGVMALAYSPRYRRTIPLPGAGWLVYG